MLQAATFALLRLATAGNSNPPVTAGCELELQACDRVLGGWRRRSGSGLLDWNSTGLCLSTAVDPKPSSLLSLQQCNASSPGQAWVLEASGTHHLRNPASGLCATVSQSHGGRIDVWGCEAKSNEEFILDVSTGELIASSKLCVLPGGVAPPFPVPALPSSPITVSLNAEGRRWDGLGGLSAGASSRLLLDYKEPQRTQILDLLFKEKTGGTWQILKTEIGGDGQSSYGSETSVMHTKNDANYHRGYETWLLQEAKARNPEIPTYCLSWTMPYWVGDYLSRAGVDYHLEYMKGVRAAVNVSFDFAGIWNEDAWTADYIEEFRAALDKEGFAQTQVVAVDGGTEIVPAMEKDPKLAKSIQVVGVHSFMPSGQDTMGARVAALDKIYWDSENNVIDGPMYPDAKHDTAVEWVSNILENFLWQNMTGMIECPLFHGWTQNLGRHNHGSIYLNDPWSGFYELGAPFWAQAQITQLTEIGWTMLPVGRGSGSFSGAAGTAGLAFVTFVSPDRFDFTVVIRGDTVRQTLTFAIDPVPKAPLHVWTTERYAPFQAAGTAMVTAAGHVTISIAADSVVSLTTVSDAQHVEFHVPQRASFPLPFLSSFDQQLVAAPGLYLSDVWGSFEVVVPPAHTAAAVAVAAGDKVLRQSAVGCPIVWHTHSGSKACGDSDPFTILPSGSNWMNYQVSVRSLVPSNATVLPGQAYGAYAVLCGRISVWPLRDEGLRNLQGSPPVGVCLLLEPAIGTWRLEERDNYAVTVLANGTLAHHSSGWRRHPPPHQTGKPAAAAVWHNLKLSFDGGTVTYSISAAGGADSLSCHGHAQTQLMNGVAGFGSGFHHAYFDDLALTPQSQARGLTPGSFLLDVTPMGTQQAGQNPAARGIAQPIVHTSVGWAGFVLATANGSVTATTPVVIDRLARYKLVNGVVNASAAGTSLPAPGVPNKNVHKMAIFDASSGESVLSNPPPSIDMQTCATDALGFCWSAPFAPVTLEPGRRYVIAAEEDGTDGYAEMTDPATGTKMGHRIGTTYMSYLTPGVGVVVGRAWRSAGVTKFSVTPEVDTSFGPVNFALHHSAWHVEPDDE